MNDILIAAIIFALYSAGRCSACCWERSCPTSISVPNRDVIRIVMAMLATLSAVVLGLLTGSSIGSLGEKDAELRSAGVQFIMLDRTLASYGPETGEIRARSSSRCLPSGSPRSGPKRVAMSRSPR